MRYFFSLFSFENLFSEISRIFRRFPLSVLLILVVSAIFAYQNEVQYISKETMTILIHVVITSILSFCLSTALILLIEKMRVRPLFQMLSAL